VGVRKREGWTLISLEAGKVPYLSGFDAGVFLSFINSFNGSAVLCQSKYWGYTSFVIQVYLL
jgi:hypothetical protein